MSSSTQDKRALIEADDQDSDYGSSIDTETESLTSSVKAYVYENGRRYHRYAEGKYPLPNDEIEQDRLDLIHHANLHMLRGKLFLAPIGDNPQRILDCGTGTGIWALDVAATFPSAEVLGVDLSPIQPAWVFPNARFEIDDLELDWTFPHNHFDFIHARMLGNSWKDWEKFCNQCFTHLKPGGYVEIAELDLSKLCSDDGTYTLETGLGVYFSNFVSAAAKAGMRHPDDQELKQYIIDAGFVDVEVHSYKQPWGAWPKNPGLKTLGQITAMNLETGFEAYSLALYTRFGGHTQESAQEIFKKAMADVLSKKVHAYSNVWHIVGRKPED